MQKRSKDHQSAVLERRRSNAAGTHRTHTPRTEQERKAINEGLEDGDGDYLHE
jgi:hypothetical protein